MKDAENYGLKYNTQYYFDNVNIEDLEAEYDVSFVGLSRGRDKEILNAKKLFDDLGIKSSITIAKDDLSEIQE